MSSTDTTSPPPPPPGPPQPPLHTRRLRRDRKHRVLGGVAAGIARTYGIDLTLVRVLWIIAAVAWIGIPAYVVAWIAIPSDDGENWRAEQPRDLGLLAGLALVGIGAFIAAQQVLPHGLRGGRFVAPLLLIAGGVAILVMRRPAETIEEEETPEPAVPPPPAPTETLPVDDVALEEPATEPARAESWSAWMQHRNWPDWREIKRDHRDARRAHRVARRERRGRPFLGPLTFSLLLIYAGAVSLLADSGTADVNLTIVFGIALCFVGAVVLLSTWFGRAHGLIVLGLILFVATAASSVIDVPLSGGIGARTYRPGNNAELRRHYELGIGNLQLDLNGGTFTGSATVDAQLGIGELHVNTPSSTTVVVHAHAGAGAVQVGDSAVKNGVGVDWRFTAGCGTDTNTHETCTSTMNLNLRVGAGHISVNG